MKWLITVWFIPSVLANVDRNKYNALVSITHDLAKDYYDCEDLFRYGPEVYSDFKEFWNPKRRLFRPQVGCLLLCIGVRRKLMDKEGNLIEHKVLGAIRDKKEPALDETALKIMQSLGHQCHKEVKQKGAKTDVCFAALQHAQCIRVGLIKLKWAPGPDEDYKRQLGLPSDINFVTKEQSCIL